MPHKDPEVRRAYAKEYNRRWARENRERRRELDRRAGTRRYAKGAERLRAAKTGPCVDCGVEFPPEVMELDHVRGEKLFQLSRWAGVRLPAGMTRYEAMDAEIAKCELRCPNCHRMRHYRERRDG